MKKIKIKFAAFWDEFDSNNNFIINILKKHYEVELSDEPDFLFTSCFDNSYLEYSCVRIIYIGENLCPDFSMFDYALGFEYMEYGDRYTRYPNWAIPELYLNDVICMQNKHLNIDEQASLNRWFCSFVVSKGKGYIDSSREEFFYKLSEYKKVNSGGRFLNNIGKPQGVEDKLEFQKKHKFVIAFENSSQIGYSTEKIVQAFAAGAIPIYWGDPHIGKIFNEKAFINVHNYSSFEEVVAEVKKIDNDDKLYLDMLKQPALANQNEMEIYQDNLEKFLVNIVEQRNSYRRDLVGWNRMKEDNFRRLELFYTSSKRNQILDKLRHIKHKLL